MGVLSECTICYLQGGRQRYIVRIAMFCCSWICLAKSQNVFAYGIECDPNKVLAGWSVIDYMERKNKWDRATSPVLIHSLIENVSYIVWPV